LIADWTTNLVNAGSVDGGGGGGGAVVCDSDGAAVGVTGGVVGVDDALGVVLAIGLVVPAASGVP
jgi:hypothetical protein